MSVTSRRLASVAEPSEGLDVWLADFARHLRLSSRSPETSKVYVRSVRQLMAHLDREDPASVTRTDVESWALELAEKGMAESTRRVRLLAVRVFFAWLLEEPATGVRTNPALKVPLPTVPDKHRRIPPVEDVLAVLKTCDSKSYVDLRDACLLLILIDCGLRRAELAALDVEDVDQARQLVTVQHGKGNRQRRVAYADRAGLAMSRFLRSRKQHRAASGQSAVFLSTRANDSGSWRLTPGAVALMLERRCLLAGVPKIQCHELRHLWADRLARAGMRETEMTYVGGWSGRSDMPRKYGAALAEERALEAQRRMSPADGLGR